MFVFSVPQWTAATTDDDGRRVAAGGGRCRHRRPRRCGARRRRRAPGPQDVLHLHRLDDDERLARRRPGPHVGLEAQQRAGHRRSERVANERGGRLHVRVRARAFGGRAHGRVDAATPPAQRVPRRCRASVEARSGVATRRRAVVPGGRRRAAARPRPLRFNRRCCSPDTCRCRRRRRRRPRRRPRPRPRARRLSKTDLGRAGCNGGAAGI